MPRAVKNISFLSFVENYPSREIRLILENNDETYIGRNLLLYKLNVLQLQYYKDIDRSKAGMSNSNTARAAHLILTAVKLSAGRNLDIFNIFSVPKHLL